MASAQVLPNSKKQEHLAAGKRRLEEFRKKRAADRGNKKAPTVQPSEPSGGSNEKQPCESERLGDSDGAGTSDGPIRGVTGPSPAVNYSDNKETDYSQKRDKSSLNYAHDNSPIFIKGLSSSSADLVQNVNDLEMNRSSSVGSAIPLDIIHSQDSKGILSESGNNSEYKVYNAYDNMYQSPVVNSRASQEFDGSSSHSSLHGVEESKSKHNISSVDDFSFKPASSFLSESSPQNYSSMQLQNEPSNSDVPASGSASYSFYRGSVQPVAHTSDSIFDVGNNVLNNHVVADSKRNELNGPVSIHSMYSGDGQSSWNTDLSSDATTTLNQVPSYSAAIESTPRRSHPSFLDSLNVSKSSSGPLFQRNGPEESFMSTGSRSHNDNIINAQESLSKHGSPDHSAFEHLPKPVIPSENGGDLSGSKVNQISFDKKPDFFLPKENEDFSALEQHIEDLTQEKFSLQRALESSRTLAESLATENSSLTDSYNQQRSVVEQLKSDMEELQQEIKAQLVELESIKMEYADVQLECNAADERAKLLASEVISLEEKVLRLRSTELKLERELENSLTEVSSYKKKLSSVERDRQDLQSTIAALQEEKKLLQSKLRKASTTGKLSDVVKNSTVKKDMSTSTDDLDDAADFFDQTHALAFPPEHGASSILHTPGNEQSSLQPAVSIPADQMRMIQNINSLISELALEKEDLIKALASESSMNIKLKDLNKELSRKLEVQTQRVELLTSQSMASDNVQTRLPDEQPLSDLTAYADEGDEVVERVLGWIMKLFPGGPSRRRTSKLVSS